MSLSNLEEKVYFSALGASAVNFETIKTWQIASNGTLKVIVHNLVKKGYFQRVKKGVYIAKKPGAPQLIDAICIAENTYKGYAAFSTALFIHKLTEEMPFTIFIATKTQSCEKNFGNYTIKAVAIGQRLMGTAKVDNYTVSTLPKTFYDCLHLPQYAGGYPNILKAIYNAKMNEKQWKEFMQYVEKFKSYAFCQRAGYMLSLLKKETNIKIPDFVLSYTKSKVKYELNLWHGTDAKEQKQKASRRFASIHPNCQYIKEWQLTDCIGKEKLLSWWYHG